MTNSQVKAPMETWWTYLPPSVDLAVGGRSYGGLARSLAERDEMLTELLRRGLEVETWLDGRSA